MSEKPTKPAERAAAPEGEPVQDAVTSSGVPVKPLYTPADVNVDPETDLGRPGTFPFTRGVYETMYRGRLWTMRQYAGFGTAEETNRRFHHLLDAGQTGLSVAFDLPTQMGYDSDDARVQGEVGRVGVAIDTIDDMRRLLDGVPLGEVSISMTINATAAILLALYVALADEQGVPRDQLRGTVQNDILKEFIARGTYIYPVEPSLQLTIDVIEFGARELPRWNPISISGYHMREAGATAAQELAFTLANGLEICRRAVERGLDLESFGPRLSFFFAAHNDLLEEVAKFRAARRLWARLLRERYDASDAVCRLRFHTQTAGSTLTAQQPLNNAVRVTVQALAAVLGGTQSLHTNAYDEALALPTEESARMALRTQQILAYESGVAATADPLAGSYYVESLTHAVEARAREYLSEIERLGGSAGAVRYMQEEIHRAAYAHQRGLESGERLTVGVNCFREEDEPRVPQQAVDYGELGRLQSARLSSFRARRNRRRSEAALARIREAAREQENLVPPIVDAVRSDATVGEISDALRAEWGTHDA